jgi:hypothetical protein
MYWRVFLRETSSTQWVVDFATTSICRWRPLSAGGDRWPPATFLVAGVLLKISCLDRTGEPRSGPPSSCTYSSAALPPFTHQNCCRHPFPFPAHPIRVRVIAGQSCPALYFRRILRMAPSVNTTDIDAPTSAPGDVVG